MSPTKISWADETWPILSGCEFASEGCRGCYAARDAFGRLKTNPKYAGLAIKRTPDELPRFTGEVRPDWAALEMPLHWRKPRVVFVASQSDFFHPAVPLDFTAAAWDVMVRSPQHFFLILTKRPERIARVLGPTGIGFYAAEGLVACPQPNIGIGTSVEDERYARIRVPRLLGAPNALPWVSVEPMIGPVSLWPWLDEPTTTGPRSAISWVVCGGESGSRARRMDPAWPRALRDECLAAGTAWHFKQPGRELAREWGADPHDPAEWPEEFREQAFPEAMMGSMDGQP